MNQESGMSNVNIGSLSPDGNFYWDGAHWKAAISPDGGWSWNGAAWAPTFQSPAVPMPPAPYASPRTLGVWVIALLGLNIAIALVQVFVVDPYFAMTLTFGNQQVLDTVDIAGAVIVTTTSVMFLIWFRRLYSNLAALGAQELRSTPGWAVGWWFIPI